MELTLRGRPTPATSDAAGPPSRRWSVVWVAATLLAVALILGVFVSLYPVNRVHVPVGDDTSTYIWRQRVVATGGLDALQAVDQYPFRPNAPNSGRPGYPVLGALVNDVTGVTSWKLAFALPGVMAGAIGLVAGVLARAALHEPMWAVPIYVVVVGLSVNLVFTATGYFDNLMADLLLLGVLALALMLVQGPPLGVAVGLLLAAGWIAHWQFTLLATALLALLFFLVLPASLRVKPFRNTPAARLAASVAGGSVAGGAALLLAPGFAPVEGNTHRHFDRILTGQGPYYSFWATVPMAAGGAAALSWPRERDRRRGMVVLAGWAAIGIGSYLLFRAGPTFPAQRVLGFALGLPLLGAAGVVGLCALVTRWIPRPRWVGICVAAIIGLLAVAGASALGVRAWFRATPYEQVTTHRTLTTAMNYVRGLPEGTPVVFAVKESRPEADFGMIPALRRLRGHAPPDRMSDIYVYLGDPEVLARGEQDIRPGAPAYNEVSNRYWPAVRDVLPQQPVILMVRAFYEPQEPFPYAKGSHFGVFRGPPLPEAPTPPDPVQPTASGLAWISGLVLVMLAVAGSGWVVALLHRPWWERAAFAPAFGLATLILGGFAADRAGMSLDGPSGTGVAVAVAVVGWIVVAVIWSVSRRRRAAAAPAIETEEVGE